MPLVAVFLAATLAAFFLFGIGVVNKGLQGILGGIPLIGGALARTISWDAGAVSWFWNLIHPHSAGVQQVTVGHATEQGLSLQAHSAAAGAIHGIKQVTIPQAVQAGVQPISAALSELGNGTTAFVAQQVQWDHDTSAQLGAIQTQTGVILPQQIEQLRGQVASDFSTITGAIATGQAQTEREIAAAGAQAAAQAQAGAVQQLAPAIGQVQTEVGSLAQQIAGAGGIGLAGVITLAQSLAGKITTVEECTAGICSAGAGNTLGDLGGLLNQLAPLLEGGLIFLLAAAAVEDAQGVANEIDQVVGGLVGETASLVESAVGLAA